MKEYLPPVSDLLALGKPELVFEFEFSQNNDYSQFDFGPNHVPELARLATDLDVYSREGETGSWGPMHAWRALATVDPVAALDAMLSILKTTMDEFETDQPAEDLVDLCEWLGAPAIPSLERYLSDVSMAEARHYVTEGLSRIGCEHPEARDMCVAVLSRQLDCAAEEDATFNGFVMAGLLNLEAVEAATAIERAFATRNVDEFIAGGWPDVQLALGLTDVEPPRMRHRLPEYGFVDSSAPPVMTHQAHSQLKAKRKAERQAKKKNRKKRR